MKTKLFGALAALAIIASAPAIAGGGHRASGTAAVAGVNLSSITATRGGIAATRGGMSASAFGNVTRGYRGVSSNAGASVGGSSHSFEWGYGVAGTALSGGAAGAACTGALC